MTATLADLPFMYLYFRTDGTEPPLFRSKEKGHGRPNQKVPGEFLPVVERFGAAVNAASAKDKSGIFEFEGVRCSFSRQTMADGGDWICARRLPSTVPTLSQLGYAPHMLNHLHGIGQREGLILIAGAAGQGKTTTAAALLTDYLSNYGGTAIAIESPLEYALNGRHGENGHCFQIEPRSNEDWETCLEQAFVWAPNFILANKIKSAKAAEILLRAATTGHTIITTVDAGTPEDALMEVLYLGEQSMGPSVQNVLAQGLTALLFQTLKEDGPFIRYLFTEENAPGDPIRTLVRENKITMLSTYIDRIAARLSNPANNHAPGQTGTKGPLPTGSGLGPLPPRKF